MGQTQIGIKTQPVLPQLSADEISDFCNVLGLAPRQLSAARKDITAQYDLGPRGAWIIGLIETGVTSPSALTDILCIGRSLMTAEVARLVDAGLVSSQQSTHDGRRLELSLTALGHQAAAHLRDAIGALVMGKLAGYDRAQVIAAITLLQDFVGATRMGDQDATGGE